MAQTGRIFTQGKHYRFTLAKDGVTRTWSAKSFDEAVRLRRRMGALGWLGWEERPP